MSAIKLKDETRTIDIDTTLDLRIGDDLLRDMIAAFVAWMEAMPALHSFECKELSPEHFSYEFADDGRTWTQTLTVPATGPYKASFASAAEWTSGELRPHRMFQEKIIAAIQTVGLTKFKFKVD